MQFFLTGFLAIMSFKKYFFYLIFIKNQIGFYPSFGVITGKLKQNYNMQIILWCLKVKFVFPASEF